MESMNILKQCQDRQVWDDYVFEHGGHPLQLWGWGEIKSLSSWWHAERLFLYSVDEAIMGAVQVLIRRLPWPLRSIAYVPRGPIVGADDRAELLDTLAKYVKKNFHSVALKIEPDSIDYKVPSGWKQTSNHILPPKTILLDLKLSESELLNNMAKKTRQYIRKSASEKVEIKRVRNREELDKCLAIYHETSKRAKFPIHSDQYYYDVANKLDDNSLLFAAYIDEQPAAFLWLAISASVAYELYGGMNEVGRQLRLNYALKWHAILRCKEWGLSLYDFGGLVDGGVSDFKLGWASEQTELAGTFDKPLSILYGIWESVLPAAKIIIRKIKSIFKR